MLLYQFSDAHKGGCHLRYNCHACDYNHGEQQNQGKGKAYRLGVRVFFSVFFIKLLQQALDMLHRDI